MALLTELETCITATANRRFGLAGWRVAFHSFDVAFGYPGSGGPVPPVMQRQTLGRHGPRASGEVRIVTRQFRALLTLSLAWSLPWAVIGVAVALGSWAPTDDPIQQMLGLPMFLTLHALVYGALGVISGLVFGLIWSRIGARDGLSGAPRSRALVAGVVGGLTPLALFGLLALAFGASNLALLPIVVGGLISALLSGGVATGLVGIAQRSVPIELEKKSVS